MASVNKGVSSAFVKHLSYFTSPQHPHTITLMSGLKSSLALGLNFPMSVLFSLALRILYSPTSLIPLQPPDLSKIRPDQERTMLESIHINRDSFSRADLVSCIPARERSPTNRGHVLGLRALAADNGTGRVSSDDLRRLQEGTLVNEIQRRRKVGRSADVVLPFWRGGPGYVAGHSWVVGKLFGVSVYLGGDGNRKD